MIEKLSRRAFLTAALATAAAVAVPWKPADSGIVVGVDLAEPGRDRVAIWLVSYKKRCADMQQIVEQAASMRWDVEIDGDEQVGGTHAVADTRAVMTDYRKLDGQIQAWWGERRKVGLMQGAGYVIGRDDWIKHAKPPREPNDETFAWWNGYYLGVDDRARFGR